VAQAVERKRAIALRKKVARWKEVEEEIRT
jgi:hypothetical protein